MEIRIDGGDMCGLPMHKIECSQSWCLRVCYNWRTPIRKVLRAGNLLSAGVLNIFCTMMAIKKYPLEQRYLALVPPFSGFCMLTGCKNHRPKQHTQNRSPAWVPIDFSQTSAPCSDIYIYIYYSRYTSLKLQPGRPHHRLGSQVAHHHSLKEVDLNRFVLQYRRECWLKTMSAAPTNLVDILRETHIWSRRLQALKVFQPTMRLNKLNTGFVKNLAAAKLLLSSCIMLKDFQRSTLTKNAHVITCQSLNHFGSFWIRFLRFCLKVNQFSKMRRRKRRESWKSGRRAGMTGTFVKATVHQGSNR